MPKYRVTGLVTNATGWQHWLIEAESPAEAVAQVEAGDGEFESEDFDVKEITFPSSEVELVE